MFLEETWLPSTEALARMIRDYLLYRLSNNKSIGGEATVPKKATVKCVRLGVFLLGAFSSAMTKLRIAALSKLIITHNGMKYIKEQQLPVIPEGAHPLIVAPASAFFHDSIPSHRLD